MILTRSSAGVQRNASKAYKAIWNTAFMGRHAGVPAPAVPGALYPDAYIIEQGPGVTLPPHFHTANEFQLVVIGGGTLGKRRCRRTISTTLARSRRMARSFPAPRGSAT